ncbi:MAG: hypothetical protein GY854_33455 [Deltaproteobacteria bacterium]|nr:hypothetical protein [Deltaproteobacteria bacterium]
MKERSINKDADNYKPRDWERCLVHSLDLAPRKRPDAIRNAAHWARTNMGLEFVELQIGSLIWERLENTLIRLLEKEELEQIPGGMIRKTESKKQDQRKTEAVLEKRYQIGKKPPEPRKRRRIVTLVDNNDESAPPSPASTKPGSRPRASTRIDRWNDWYLRMREFVAREGHARVPTRQKEDGYELGQWVRNQRKARGRLSEERKAALEQLPGWIWSPNQRIWEDRYESLLKYVEREGHARVSRLYKKDSLGQWVYDQRKAKEKLSKERKAALERLPGWIWSANQKTWKDGYGILLEYVKREGHARVPKRYKEDGYGIGQWVSDQRKAREKLSVDRKAALERLPGWAWSVWKNRWEEKFELLLRYVEREGHATMPNKHIENGEPLGLWVSTQRKQRDKLSPERKAALERQPGWAWRLTR